MTGVDGYRDVFLAESTDFLQQVVDGLLALEADSRDSGPVEVVFRGAHSLKGMAAAMGYGRTAEVTHKMEGVMDRVRRGELPADIEVIGLMLSAVDLVRDLIEDEMAGVTRVDEAEMLAALEELAARGSATPEAPAAPATGGLPPRGAGACADAGAEGAMRLVTVTLEPTCVLKAVRAYMVVKRLAHIGTVIETQPSERDLEDERFELTFSVVLDSRMSDDEIRTAAEYVTEVESATVAPFAAPRQPATSAGGVSPGAVTRREAPKVGQSQTVRVSIGHLDALVDMVGELVVLRSRLERLVARSGDQELREAMDDLHRVSMDLQYEVMQTRMVPVGNIFNRFPRMVRDLALDLGKSVEFRMEGLDIELDRTVLDEIGDPLVHLLRNSIDHGIEEAAQREAAGKPARGAVTLVASRERDHVAITVSDDGCGMDTERIWEKAVERGIVHPAEREDHSDTEILMFTCLPGFSTAAQATRVSGRGVGMDAVKGKVEYLGGTVQILSQKGHGTRFVMRLPLTLAIVQALLVESRGQGFALPLSAVDEVFRADELAIDTIDGYPVVILRDGSVTPLRRLDALLFDGSSRDLPRPDSSVVLLQTGTGGAALHVDRVIGRQDVVVKPLSRLLRHQQGFSGATVLGDGRVMLILDPRAFSTMEA